MLAFGLRLTTEPVAAEMLDAFLATAFDDTERAAVDRLAGSERARSIEPGR